jgi:tetratricopeptide (TPR) repeat protein
MVRAAPGGLGDGDIWRVFISHTSELQEFPRGRSYVSEVKQAITAAGHVVVDMSAFPAADQPPAELCEERVRGCDVYVVVLGTRYGSPVRDRPAVSYTELEFDTATRAGLSRLVFMLDPNAETVSIPPAQLMDREFGDRQDAFRRRVRDSGLITQSFADPATLGQLVERSLRELADTRRRISSGIQREQVPAEPQPVRSSKFVNPPPAVAPTWFQGRQIETGLLAKYVTDPGIRMVTVLGRGGIGKTAMVCRLLKGLETGRVPGADGDRERITVAGIVYLSHNGVHPVEYPTLIEDLLRLLPAEAAERLQRRYQDPHHSPRKVMLALLEAFPAGDPVVVLLDNLESAMDTEQETLVEPALHEALTAVLTGPAHAVTVLATTRVTPTELLKLEPAAQRQLRLDAGLGSPDAEDVLRALDDDGRLGLRDAADEVLDGLRRHTRGFPRALEAVKAILDGDETLTPRDLLDRTRRLPADQVLQALVGEAYELLDSPAQQVMQALSVYPGPVSAVAVDFLLSPVHPTINSVPILARLVRRRLVRFQDGHYDLHPIDRDYASGRLRAGSLGDSASELTLAGLRARAGDYYVRVRTPRESWRGLDDVRPQLAEFELRCDIGDYDTAAMVLADIDFDYLRVWGHNRMLADLHARIHDRISDPLIDADHLNDFGLCTESLGDYRRAIDLHTQALITAQETGNRQAEGNQLGNLGLCHQSLGDHRQAIDLHTQSLAIARDFGDQQTELNQLGNLGLCHHSLGDYQQAIDLHTQSLAIARDIGDRQSEGNQLGNLGICHYSLGDYRQAIDLHTQALAITRETGNRRIEVIQLGNLGICHYSLGDYRQAIELHTQSLTLARETGNRQSEGHQLGNLGLCHHSLGDYRRAIDLHTQSLTLARETGNRYNEGNILTYLGRSRLASGDPREAAALLERAIQVADSTGDVEPAAEARSWLARTRIELGEPSGAIAVTTAAREWPYPTEEPVLRLLEGVALLELRQVDEAVAAFTDAVATADPLLALADRNVAALQARALALTGLAAASGDATSAGRAAKAFGRADTVTIAAGVVADTGRLLDRIARHDRTGTVAGIRERRQP